MVIPKQIDLSLKNILKEAGKLLLFYWHKDIEKNRKKDGSLVTEADIASEMFLMTELNALFHQADFWSEESGQSGSNNSGYRWVIDPLDGTRNFASSIPYFCISVALTYHDVPIVSAIYNPLLDEFFYAQKEGGAYCNELKIEVSKEQNFSSCFIAFGISHVQSKRLGLIKAAQVLVAEAAAVRHTGAVALDLAYVAIGRFDGAIFTHLSWWDVAAGALLVQEAGGKISDIQGKTIGPEYMGCIAGSAMVFGNLHRVYKSAV